jgi:hypothetical protein
VGWENVLIFWFSVEDSERGTGATRVARGCILPTAAGRGERCTPGCIRIWSFRLRIEACRIRGGSRYSVYCTYPLRIGQVETSRSARSQIQSRTSSGADWGQLVDCRSTGSRGRLADTQGCFLGWSNNIAYCSMATTLLMAHVGRFAGATKRVLPCKASERKLGKGEGAAVCAACDTTLIVTGQRSSTAVKVEQACVETCERRGSHQSPVLSPSFSCSMIGGHELCVR